jgi:anthranilate/para-aminobenzoate synthase component I
MVVDKLSLYRGEDFKINDNIIIHQPTLGEICEFGEEKYYSVIQTLTAIPSDMKSQLDDVGIDYEAISDFELFIILSKTLDSNDTKIVFGDLDLSRFEVYTDTTNGETVLAQKVINEKEIQFKEIRNKKLNYIQKILYKFLKLPIAEEVYETKTEFEEKIIIIDRLIYQIISDYLCKTHGFKKKVELAGNEFTKRYLIQESRDKIEANKNIKFESMLYPLVSAMINSAGFKYNHKQIWDMKINAFMDSVHRIQKIINVGYMMQGIYSGNIDSSKLNKDELNWIGELK